MAGADTMSAVSNAMEAEEYLREKFLGPSRYPDPRALMTLHDVLRREFAECAPGVQGLVRDAIESCLAQLANPDAKWYQDDENRESAASELLMLARAEGGVVDEGHRARALALLKAIPDDINLRIAHHEHDVHRRVVGTIVANLGGDEASENFIGENGGKYTVEALMKVAEGLGEFLHMVEAFHGAEKALELAQKQQKLAGGENMPLLLKIAIMASHRKDEWTVMLRAIAMAGKSSEIDSALVKAIQEALGGRD